MKELIKLRIAYLAAAYNQGYADCEADELMNETPEEMEEKDLTLI